MNKFEPTDIVRRRKHTRPDEIIRAAQTIFFRKGFAAARLEDMAALAGISKSTIFLYFESKELLFKSALENGLAPMMRALDGLAVESGHPAEQLRLYLRASQKILSEDRQSNLLRLLAGEGSNFPEVLAWFQASVAQRMKRDIVIALENGVASGEFRRLKPDVVASIFVALISFGATDKMWNCGSSIEDLLDTVLTLLMAGVDERGIFQAVCT